MGKQTLRAITWQNLELGKRSRAITETALQIGQAALRMAEVEIGSTLKELETQEDLLVTIDTNTANILRLMGAQSNPQLQLHIKNIAKREYEVNGVNVTLEQDAFLVGDYIFEFSDDFINFLTGPDIKYEDIEDEDAEKNIKIFLRDIRYDTWKVTRKVEDSEQ